MARINQNIPNNLFQNFENGIKGSSQNNFGALNSQQLKADTVHIAKKAEKEVKENWLFSMMRNTFGVENPKKTLTSISLAILTTMGLAYLGNRFSNKTAELGIAVDEKLLGNKYYTAVSNTLKSAADGIKNFLLKHSKSARDIADTYKNRPAKAKWSFLGTGQGFKSIFRMTPPDIAGKALKNSTGQYESLKSALSKCRSAKKALKGLTAGTDKYNSAMEAFNKAKNELDKLIKDSGSSNALEMMHKTKNSILSSFQKLTGTKDNTAQELTRHVLGLKKLENKDFVSKLSDGIRKNFNCRSNKEFLNCLMQGQKGSINGIDVREFTNIVMAEKGLGGIIGSWHPANFVNKIVSFFTGKPSKIGRGNLFDSLVKVNAVEGKLADTFLGSLVQKSVTIPTESISNFVNDKSTFGALLCAGILKPLFDKLQDTPKEKRIAVAADDLAGSMGSLAVTTPLACAGAYGLASLGNLKGDTLLTKLLKIPGRFFNIGLDKYNPDGSKFIKQTIPGNFSSLSGIWQSLKNLVSGTASKIKNISGGVLRIWLILFVFGSMFSKPLHKIIHKIFGEPEDIKPQPPQKQAGNSINRRSSGETNLINQWASAPVSKNIEQNKNTGRTAAASRLSAEREETYIPSIQADYSYLIDEENAVNERVQKILKRNDAKMSRLSKSIRSI